MLLCFSIKFSPISTDQCAECDIVTWSTELQNRDLTTRVNDLTTVRLYLCFEMTRVNKNKDFYGSSCRLLSKRSCC